MDSSKEGSKREPSEKLSLGLEGDIPPTEIITGEVLEEDNEVFKVNGSEAQFRTLGL